MNRIVVVRWKIGEWKDDFLLVVFFILLRVWNQERNLYSQRERSCILSTKAINLNRNVIRLDNVSRNTMWKLFLLFLFLFRVSLCANRIRRVNKQMLSRSNSSRYSFCAYCAVCEWLCAYFSFFSILIILPRRCSIILYSRPLTPFPLPTTSTIAAYFFFFPSWADDYYYYRYCNCQRSTTIQKWKTLSISRIVWVGAKYKWKKKELHRGKIKQN